MNTIPLRSPFHLRHVPRYHLWSEEITGEAPAALMYDLGMKTLPRPPAYGRRQGRGPSTGPSEPPG